MSANAIRQAPGWWASLVRAECDQCNWIGPTRDINTTTGQNLARLDRSWHLCGEDDPGVMPTAPDERNRQISGGDSE